MGNCATLQKSSYTLINVNNSQHSPLLQNTTNDMKEWYSKIKDALMISSGYSCLNDHSLILDCIISYILFSTGMFVDDLCEYNPATNEFNIRFQDHCKNILNVDLPKYEIDLVDHNDNKHKCKDYSFDVFVSKSGYIFIAEIGIGWSQIDSNNWETKQSVIYSKITENMKKQIIIESPWKIYSKYSHSANRLDDQKETWQFKQHLISNYWGLIHCFYNSDTLHPDIGNRNNQICIIDPTNYKKYSFIFQSFSFGLIKIFTKQELIHIGLLNEENVICNLEHRMEYVLVCDYQKNKNVLTIYELPTGKLIKTQNIKNIDGYVICYNINIEEQCLMLITKPSTKRLFKLKLSCVKIIKYDIIKQQILVQKHLSNNMVTGHWRCTNISYFMKNIDQDWTLSIFFGDGGSEPSQIEIKIIFDKQFNEKERVKGPSKWFFAGGFGFSTKSSDVDWMYHPFSVSFDPPI